MDRPLVSAGRRLVPARGGLKLMSRWSIPLVCLLVGGIVGSFIASPLLRGENPVAVSPAISKDFPSYREIVKKVLPAVVSIDTKVKPKISKSKKGESARPSADDPS